MIGIPPATLASKKKLTPFSLAMPSSSAPCFATSSLLEVHTLFPFKRADFTKEYAGLTPHITSTITETSLSLRIMLKS